MLHWQNATSSCTFPAYETYHYGNSFNKRKETKLFSTQTWCFFKVKTVLNCRQIISKLSLSICMSHCSISISQSKHARRKISTQKLVIWINMWPTFVAVQLLPLPFCKEEVRVVQPGCHAYMYHRVYSTYTICGMHGHTHTHTHTNTHAQVRIACTSHYTHCGIE